MALLIISGLIAAGADSPTIFLVLAGLVGIGLLITAATDGPAAARAVTHARLLATRGTTDPKAPTHSRGERPDTPTTWAFGLVLAVLFLSWSAFATLETQYANYMDQVFGIDTGVAAAALAVAVLFTIPMYPWAGRLATWVRYKVPIQSSTAARVGVGVALWLVAAPESVPAVLPLALYVVLMLSLPLYEINGTLLSAVTSPGRPGRGQGGYGFALAASFIAGAVVAGWAADAFGYRSLAIIAAAIALVALALGSRLSDARAESGA
jgi:predicted MFS family arabinose efflux permease